jgi:uncharacterized protein (DUF302 family)
LIGSAPISHKGVAEYQKAWWRFIVAIKFKGMIKMLGKIFKILLIAGSALLLFSGCATPAKVTQGGMYESNTGVVTKPSKYSVVETMDKMEASAKAVGAHIFSRVDWQELSKKVNVDIPPNQLLIFGRGKGGPYIIKEAALAALDIPFKAVAWEDSAGKVWLSYTNGTYIKQRYAIDGAATAANDIDATIEKITSEALK